MKDLVLFTRDEQLVEFFKNNSKNYTVLYYDFNKNLEDVDFNNKLVLIDYDYDDMDMNEFLLNIRKSIDKSIQVLVLSKNCDRKVISDVAKNGADRFIVKPLTKKRYKDFFLPYLEAN